MAKAKPLWPDIDELGRCEAQREGKYCASWELAHPDKRCMHTAKYEVDGRKLCARHASLSALRIMLKETRDNEATSTDND